MRKIAIVLAALSLAGCAQWNQMTPGERKVVIGAAVASAVVAGAIAAHNDDPDAYVTNVWQEWKYRPRFCAGKNCK